ncbi:MAG: AMP-binding protein [Parvularculaceae bacterium]|nr:AMP-binding protein [Parvularculaceae bacterium]
MSGRSLSIVAGPPLAEEPGLGALTLGGYLRETTARFGSREALAFRRGETVERWTYDDLWMRSVEVARALVAAGVDRGTRVGILMTNRPEFLSAFFGAALAGGVATPLSTFSTPAELDHLLQASACGVLLFEREILKKDFLDILASLEPAVATATPSAFASLRFPYLRRLAVVGAGAGAAQSWSAFLASGEAVAPARIDARRAAVFPSDPGALFFSSGSTAKPKGVLNAHRGVSIQLWRWPRILGLDGNARCWAANGFFWSGNFGMTVGGALSRGGAIVLQQTFDPEEALTLMERERVDYPFAWPHQYAQLEAAPNWSRVELSALRYVPDDGVFARRSEVKTTWREPRAAFGNTEMFTMATGFAADAPTEDIRGSSGRPLPGNTIKIVDPLSGEILPVGETGEIAVKGATLMLGYLGLPPEETLDAEGFLRTGDGGHVDAEGRLYWKGRLNDIIKTGGANVSPAEVDAVIAQHPGVKVVQTVGLPHDTLGEIVVSCVVPRAGAAIEEEGVRAFAKATLASYKVPRRVLFFAEDEIALTGSNKIKTGELRERAARKL